MSITNLPMSVMALPFIPAHTFLWGSDGGGIPFYIGVSLIARGIIPLITMQCLTTDIIMGIPAFGEVIIRDMDGDTIQDGDIPPTDTGKPP